MGRFDKYPNVYWLGYRAYEQIPAYGSGFAVALMPWLDNPWIRHSNPIKLKEYLALGLSVFSTGFAEVARYTDRVHVATTPADFAAAIRATLADGGLGSPDERRRSVTGSSWKHAETLIKLAEERPPRLLRRARQHRRGGGLPHPGDAALVQGAAAAASARASPGNG